MPARTAAQQQRRSSPTATSSGAERDGAAVGGRDHEQRDDVVDDGDGEHERAQPVGKPRPDEREQPEREGRVGRHRRAPAVDRAVPPALIAR